MADDMKLTAKVAVEVVDEALQNFEELLSGVLKKMNAVEGAAKDFLKGIPQANQVEKVLKKTVRELKNEENALQRNTKEQKKNTRAKKANDKASKNQYKSTGKTAAAFGGVTAKLAQIRVAAGLTSYAVGGLIATMAVPAGIVAGWTYFLKTVSDTERHLQSAAQAVDVSSNFLSGLTVVAEDAGLSMENASDQLEELVNRVGDAIEDPGGKSGTMFSRIGLDALQLKDDLQELGREATYKKVIDSILRSDLTDALKVRAGDELFGGEGNRMLATFVRMQKETGKLGSAQIDMYSKMVGKSKEATTAANNFSRQFELIGKVVQSLFIESLRPTFEETGALLGAVTDYATENREAFVAIGKELSGNFGKVIYYVADLLLDMMLIIARNKTMIITTVKAIGAAFSFIIKPVLFAIDGLSQLHDVFKFLLVALVAGKVFLMKFGSAVLWAFAPLAAKVILVYALITALIHLYENSEEAWKGLKVLGEGILTFFKTIGDVLLGIADGITAPFQLVFSFITGGFSVVEKKTKEIFDRMTTRFKGVTQTLKNAANTVKALVGMDTAEDDGPSPEATAHIQKMRANMARIEKLKTQAAGGVEKNVNNNNNNSSSTIDNSSTSGDTIINVDATNMSAEELDTFIESKGNH